MFAEATYMYTARFPGLFPGNKISFFKWCDIKCLISFGWCKYGNRPGKTEMLAKDVFADKKKTDEDKGEWFIHASGISV